MSRGPFLMRASVETGGGGVRAGVRRTATAIIRMVVGVVVVILCVAVARAEPLENPNLLVVEDHFLDTSGLQQAATTAMVATSPPGTVRLPWRPGGLSLRPGAVETAVCARDTVRFYVFNGASMAEVPGRSIAFSGVASISHSEDGSVLFAASPTEVRAYAFTQGGVPVLAGRVTGLSGVVSVEKAAGRDFWILTVGQASYYAWNGTSYVERPGLRLTGFSNARGISRRPEGLVVLDGETVKRFRFSGSSFVEQPAYAVTVQGATAVVQVDGGFRVLIGNGTRTQFYVFDAGASRRLATLDDNLLGAVAVAPSPWGLWEYAVIGPEGISYRSLIGGGMGEYLGFSVRTPFGVGYEPSAVVVSRVFPAIEPVTRVRLESMESVPSGCSVTYEVGTDGGVTWTPVVPGTNVDTPSGMSLCWKATLQSTNPLVSPEIDYVRLLQIGYKVVPGSQVGLGLGRARLVQ